MPCRQLLFEELVLMDEGGTRSAGRAPPRRKLAMSGRAVEAASDVDTLLLDKAGTITLGSWVS